VSPIPAIAVAALLGTEGALRAASAFVVGEAVAVGAIAAIVVAASAGSAKESLGFALAFIQLGIAALLVLLLIAHLRLGRDKPASQRMLAGLDGAAVRTPVAFASGAAMVAVNPKNLALALAGGTAILQLDAAWSVRAAIVVAFTALAVSLLTAEVVAYALSPRRAASLLARGRAVVLQHERRVVSAVLLGLAVLFVTLGLLGLRR